MPAYFDTGFSVRQPMWHGLGDVLADYPTDWADARRKAGLEWEPVLRPIYTFTSAPSGVVAAGTSAMIDWAGEHDGARFVGGEDPGMVVPLGTHRRVARDDTDATLGVVSDQFSLVSHDTMGDVLETVLGLENVKFETAGSCKGGAQVWALAYLDEPVEVAGDDSPTLPFLALLNSHDGSGACKIVATSVRVVCWNTYQAASMEGARSGREFVFRHVGDVASRIEEAKAAIAGVRDEHSQWVKLADDLALLKVTAAQFAEFVELFLPTPPAGTFSDRVQKNVDRSRDVFRSLYLESPTTDGHRGTVLGLVDASVEYLDHARGYRNRDTYLGRTMLRPEPLKARALSLARQVVGV